MKNFNFRFDNNNLKNEIYHRLETESKEVQGSMRIENKLHPGFNSNMDYMDIFDSLPKLNAIDQNSFKLDDETKIITNLHHLNALRSDDIDRIDDSLQALNPKKAKQFRELRTINKYLGMDQLKYEKSMDSLRGSDSILWQKISALKRNNELEKIKANDLRDHPEELFKKGLITKREKLFLDFKKLGIGDNYPIYTPLTISGIKVRGLDMLYSPGKYFIGITTGVSPQIKQSLKQSYDRTDKMIFAACIGVGALNKNYFRLSVVDASEIGKFNPSDIVSGSYRYRPATRTSSVDFRILPIKGLELSGELAISELRNPGTENSPPISNSGKSIETIFSEQSAFNLTGKYSLTKFHSKVFGEVRRIDPNYTTFAIPFLRHDVLNYKGGIESYFFRQQVSTQFYIETESDNLNRQKYLTSNLSSLGGNVSLCFTGLPSIFISFTPYVQTNQNQADSFYLTSTYNTWLCQAEYQFYIRKFVFLTIVNYLNQRENIQDQRSIATHFNGISASEIIKMSKKVSVNANFSVTNYVLASGKTLETHSYEGSFGYVISKTVEIKGGAIYSVLNKSDRFSGLFSIVYTTRRNISIQAQLKRIDTIAGLNTEKNAGYDCRIRICYKW